MADYIHKTVMLMEAVEALQPKASGRYADGTCGGGGHAAAILEKSSPTGWLYGFDRDGEALATCRERLSPFAGRWELIQSNFSEMNQWIEKETLDGIVLDLGVSSHQLDTADRGFSFHQSAALDMRMDRRQPMSARDLVNTADEQELARWIFELGDERHSRRIARRIVEQRRQKPIETTTELAEIIRRAMPPSRDKIHPATRTFQALRMVVNRELESLQEGLLAAMELLKPGGRLAVITFHSGEDREVKRFARDLERDYEPGAPEDPPALRRPRPQLARRVNRKPVLPSEAEIRENPRSRSAKLRILEKV